MDNTWSCSLCTFINENINNKCSCCDTDREINEEVEEEILENSIPITNNNTYISRICSICTYNNQHLGNRCELCDKQLNILNEVETKIQSTKKILISK